MKMNRLTTRIWFIGKVMGKKNRHLVGNGLKMIGGLQVCLEKVMSFSQE